MAQVTSTPVPTTATVPNHPVPPSTLVSSTLVTSGSLSSSLASITSHSSIAPASSANGTFNSTATTSSVTFAWDCPSSIPARASLFENFSGCSYASSTPTAKPTNATANGTISSGVPLPTNNAALRLGTGVEYGSMGALGLVFLAMMGWL